MEPTPQRQILPLLLGVGQAASPFSEWFQRFGGRGFRVRLCDGPEGLLALLREEVIHLVVVDSRPPDEALAQLVPFLRRSAPDMPIVLAREGPAATVPPRQLGQGVRWICSRSDPPEETAVGFRALIESFDRQRGAELAFKTAQSQLNVERGRFQKLDRTLRELNHELSTPLTVIQGYCANLQDGFCGPLSTEQEQAVERMRYACTMMTGMLGSMKQRLPRTEEAGQAQRQPPDPRLRQRRQLRLAQLAAEVVAFFEFPYAAKGVALALEQRGECHPIWADRERLSQLLVNLLSNALRHTPAGGRVQVIVGPDTLGSQEAARLSVQDSGPGIAPEHLEDIWVAGWSRTAEPAGRRAGLGLAICREIAKEHCARLWVDSEPGQGAAFHVQLPLDPRSRGRQTQLHLVPDSTLAGQLMMELRQRSEGPVQVSPANDMEELATRVQNLGLPVILVGPLEPGMVKALGFVRGEA